LKSGIQQTEKRINRGRVLQLICTGEARSRLELSKATGLTKMTITNAVNEWIREGWIYESEQVRTAGAGRNPAVLGLTPLSPLIIGVHLAREHISALLCDMSLNVLRRDRIELCGEDEATLIDKIFDIIDRLGSIGEDEKQNGEGSAVSVGDGINGRRILGIGVSSIGPLDCQNGILLGVPNFYGIKRLELGRMLRERYRLPVLVDNDMNLAAIAEKQFGGGRPLDDFLYVGITHGIGAGIIYDSRLLHNSGMTGEIGHMSVSWNGEPCVCGSRGCLEGYASVPVVLERIEREIGLKLTFEEACASENKGVRAIMDDVCECISTAFVGLVNILAPQAVFIGHEGACFSDEVLEHIEENVNSRSLSGRQRSVSVSRSAFGEHAALFGSACGILERVFTGRDIPL